MLDLQQKVVVRSVDIVTEYLYGTIVNVATNDKGKAVYAVKLKDATQTEPVRWYEHKVVFALDKAEF